MCAPLAANDQVKGVFDRKGETSAKILTAQEEQNAREILSQERRHLSSIDREIDRLKTALTEIYNERQSCVTCINDHSRALSPHKCLPSELLARIFVHSLSGQAAELPPKSTKPPWVFLWVCSGWRRVACAEHRLWDHLDVKEGFRSPERMVRYWIPQIWDPMQITPLSLNVASSELAFPFFEILSPYIKRLRALGLNISEESLFTFLITPSIPFDDLESLSLTLRWGISSPPHTPFLGFSASPKLYNLTIIGSFDTALVLSNIFQSLWTQLTCLTLFQGNIPLSGLGSILRSCTKLVSLTFSPEISFSPQSDPMPEILLPSLESITLIILGQIISQRASIFRHLRVPLLKEFSMTDRSEGRASYSWYHPQFIDMLSRSGCMLKSLTISIVLKDIVLENLLAALPSLVELRIPHSKSIPGELFHMMIRGEILPNLKHLECSTPSPICFLKLLEYYYDLPASEEHTGLSFASVSYKRPSSGEEERWIEYDELYEILKPKIENGDRSITLHEI